MKYTLWAHHPTKPSKQREITRANTLRWIRRSNVLFGLLCGGNNVWLALHTNAEYNGSSMRIDGTPEELAAFILKFLKPELELHFDCITYRAVQLRRLMYNYTQWERESLDVGMDIGFFIEPSLINGIVNVERHAHVFAVNGDSVGLSFDTDDDQRRTFWLPRSLLSSLHRLTRKES